MKEIANKINDEIKKSIEYKEYTRLKKILEEDKTLNSMKEELENLKKEICSSKSEELIEVYYLKEQEYKNNYLVKDYLRSQEVLKELFKEIVDILSVN